MQIRLVLLGAGHAHVEVLRRLARERPPGLHVTLVAREAHSPYSGMLPALVRREVEPRDALVDCAALARAAGAELVVAEVRAIAFAPNAVLADGAVVRFDLLSINVGGAPAPIGAHGIPVKPIGQFLDRLTELESRLGPGSRVAVVGGGPGGVELALALAQRWGSRVALTLVSGTATLLAAAPEAARASVLAALAAARIEVVAGVAAGDHFGGQLALADGTSLAADAALWATGVAAPAFLARAGFACDERGCVRVDRSLQSVSHNGVFAAGDCATLDGDPRPKAGVWAVRAGPVLAANLIAEAVGRPLAEWHPQRDALAILGLGHGRAVAWRGRFSAAGRLAAWWKVRIDRRWMARYPRPG